MIAVRDRVRALSEDGERTWPIITYWLLGWLLVHNWFMVRWQLRWITVTYPRYTWWNMRHYPFQVRHRLFTERQKANQRRWGYAALVVVLVLLLRS